MRLSRLALLTIVVALFAASCGSEGNVFSLEAGDCFGSTEGTEISDVPLVDCSEPHENEVYAVWDVTGDSLPGVEEFTAGCVDRFDDAIGSDYATSAIFSQAIYPSSGSWDQGDREVICYGFEFDESGEVAKVTGSIIGSGR